MVKPLRVIGALILLGLMAVIYYGNVIAPSLRPISKVAMTNYLVENKSELWLQERISNGQEIYNTKVKQERQAWIEKHNNLKKIYTRCREATEAYRMKNAYECNNAWAELGGIGEFGFLLSQDTERPDFHLRFDRDAIIQMSILGDCAKFENVGQAKENGCYYK